MEALHTFRFNPNQLAALTQSFGQQAALQTFRSDPNQLAASARSFGQLTALQTFRFDPNQLGALAKSFGPLTALQAFRFDPNQLAALARSFGQLKALRILRVLRPLRLLQRNAGMKVIIVSLIDTMPSVVEVSAVVLVFHIVFAILGMMLFSWLDAQRAARRCWLRSGQSRFLVMLKAVEEEMSS